MKKKKDDKANGKKEKNDVVVLSTPQFRLKDDPPVYKIHIISLKRQFGTIPDVIAVEKVKGQNNSLIVRAFAPPEIVESKIEIARALPKRVGKNTRKK